MSDDVTMRWDGARWLRWDGTQWLDATSGLPLVPEAQLNPADDPTLQYDDVRNQWVRWNGGRYVNAVTGQRAPKPLRVAQDPPPWVGARAAQSPSHPAANSPRRRGFWFVIIPVGMVLLCGALAASYFLSFWTDHPGTTEKAVTYTVSGTGTGGVITVTTGTGIKQENATKLPQTFSARLNPGSPVVLSIQNGKSSGSVTCKIEVGSTVVSTNTTNAAYGVAQCSGTVPLF